MATTTKKTTWGKAAARAGKIPVETYTVAIDDLVVVIKSSEFGGYIVTCPFDPELVTQGKTLDEAVAMAKDAHKTLMEARSKKSPRAKPSKSDAKA